MLELDPDFDPAERELCPDGSCVGVIGDDGRCRECGLAGDPAKARSTSSKHGAESEAEPASPVRAAGGSEPSEGSDDDDRQLCSDGACIGLIGDDRRCKVCGLPAAS